MPPCDVLALTDYLVLFRSFNPCFSGCRPATQVYIDVFPVWDMVSILVLVDAALRHDQDYSVYGNGGSFNPCFSGCRPATYLPFYILTSSPKFQSLF